jgi:hypothetical protein
MTSKLGNKYFVPFIGADSNFVFVRLMSLESQDLKNCHRNSMLFEDPDIPRKKKVLRCEKSGDYDSQDWIRYCLEDGMDH